MDKEQRPSHDHREERKAIAASMFILMMIKAIIASVFILMMVVRHLVSRADSLRSALPGRATRSVDREVRMTPATVRT